MTYPQGRASDSIFTDNNLSKSARDNNDGQYDGHLFCEQDQACSRDGSRSIDSNSVGLLDVPVPMTDSIEGRPRGLHEDNLFKGITFDSYENSFKDVGDQCPNSREVG